MYNNHNKSNNSIMLKFDKISTVKFLNDSILNGIKHNIKHFTLNILDDSVFLMFVHQLQEYLNIMKTWA